MQKKALDDETDVKKNKRQVVLFFQGSLSVWTHNFLYCNFLYIHGLKDESWAFWVVNYSFYPACERYVNIGHTFRVWLCCGLVFDSYYNLTVTPLSSPNTNCIHLYIYTVIVLYLTLLLCGFALTNAFSIPVTAEQSTFESIKIVFSPSAESSVRQDEY